MKTYFVIYKLASEETNYPNLLTYLKSATYWARPMENAWIIKTTTNAAGIRDGAKTKMLAADKILVISLPNNDWATFNISSVVTSWMKKNL